MAVKLREKLHNTDTFTVGSSDIARGKCVVLNNGVVETSGANAAKFVGITTETGYAGKDVRVTASSGGKQDTKELTLPGATGTVAKLTA